MNETMYLVDNNALTALGRHRIRSEFFHTYCRVTSDVLFEADQHPDRTALRAVEKPTTPELLYKLRSVMGTLSVGDIQLVDLYGNKGAADPGLVASVLETIAAQDGKFFGDTWVVVTNDRAVAAKASEFNIETFKPDELAGLIDASNGSEG